MLEEFARRLALLQHLDQMPQPAIGVGLSSRRLEAVERLLGIGRILVDRMCGHAPFRDLVHQPRADLHFDAHVMRPDHRRMDRAVVVLLRCRDVILEAPRHGAIGAVNDAERAVALVHRAHQHAKAEDVGKLAERQKLPLHLAEDRIGPLLAPMHFRLDAVVGQLLRQLLLDRFENVAALGMKLRQPVGDDAVGFRVQHLEGDVLELVPHRLHAHAAGQRRIDLHRLLCDPRTLLRLHMPKGPHVVQPVGQLHQQHPHVLRHGQQQLPQVLGLRRFLGHEIELGDLGQPVHQRGDLGSELLLDLLMRGFRVFHRVMQQRGGNRRRVELHLGQDRGHFERDG
jgi:hypothetical protein